VCGGGDGLGHLLLAPHDSLPLVLIGTPIGAYSRLPRRPARPFQHRLETIDLAAWHSGA
jgi:hypothetical protein